MSDLVIITRPSEDAHDYAEELEMQGFRYFVEPMLAIEPAAFELPDLSQYQGLLFTSANAVRLFCGRAFEGGEAAAVRDIPLFVVGKYTAMVAAEMGFTTIRDAGGTGDDLADLITGAGLDKARKLLHVRGKHVARPLEEILAPHGFQVDLLVVYEAVRVQRFSDEFIALLDKKEPMAAVFYSKRTAESFIALAEKAGRLNALLSTKALCVSAAVLEYVQPYDWADTYSSEVPNRDGMLALLEGTSK